MKEYIERAAAEQAIAAIMPSMSTPDGAGANDEMVFAAQEMCADALNTIRRIPAAEVAEVKHGRWVRDKWPSRTHKLICSECGEWSSKKSRYCPSCGALMKGDEHEVSE